MPPRRPPRARLRTVACPFPRYRPPCPGLYRVQELRHTPERHRETRTCVTREVAGAPRLASPPTVTRGTNPASGTSYILPLQRSVERLKSHPGQRIEHQSCNRPTLRIPTIFTGSSTASGPARRTPTFPSTSA